MRPKARQSGRDDPSIRRLAHETGQRLVFAAIPLGLVGALTGHPGLMALSVGLVALAILVGLAAVAARWRER